MKSALNLDLTLSDDGKCPALLKSSGIIDLGAFYVELWIFAPGGRLNHEAYNVRTIVFMISKNTIPYIGTEILYETCDGHNSTQNAPKSIIPEDSKSAGHFP